MLNFMTSTILAFTVISSSADTLLVNDFNSFDISHISYEAKEVEWHYSGIIGRQPVHAGSFLFIFRYSSYRYPLQLLRRECANGFSF